MDVVSSSSVFNLKKLKQVECGKNSSESKQEVNLMFRKMLEAFVLYTFASGKITHKR